jgi:hypothetical protein
VICGPTALEEAVDDPTQRAQIDYVAINTHDPSSELVKLHVKVQEKASRWFTWSDKAMPGHLSELTKTELDLVRKQNGELKWRHCPTHDHIKDYCMQPFTVIPNGPNK